MQQNQTPEIFGLSGTPEIVRDMVNTTTTGQALVRKVVVGSGLVGTSTGVDDGTGDVTVGMPTLPGVAGVSWSSVTTDEYGRVVGGVVGIGSTLPIATPSVLGCIKVGSGLGVTAEGVLYTTGSGGGSYTLPIATSLTLGGIRIGSGLSIDGSGVVSVSGSSYTLPTASAVVLGGVKIGTGLSINGSGVLSFDNATLNAFTGTSSIVTLGVIASGTWNGSAIGAQYGGTGFTSYSIGDLLYAGSTTSLSKFTPTGSGLFKWNGSTWSIDTTTYQASNANLLSLASAGLPGTSGYVLSSTTSGVFSWVAMSGGGGGTVTSIALSAPSIFTVSGSPVTTTGTLSFAWNGNSTDFVLGDGSTVARSTYLTTSSAASTYQPLDGDLTSIAGLAGTSGLARKTAANTWSLDTNTYLTANQSITWTASGDVSGTASGATSITPSVTVTGIQGKSITLAAGNLKYNGSAWVFDNTTYQPLATNLTTFGALGNPASNGYVLSSTTAGVMSWIPVSGGGGTVTSVALSAPSLFTVSGSPVATTGTLSFAWNGASTNLVRADGSVVAASTYATTASPTFTGTLTTPALTLSGFSTGTLINTAGVVSALSGTNLVLGNGTTIAQSTFLTANQSITLSGAVTGTGTTAITTALAAGVVGLSNMSALAAYSVIGNMTGSSATPTAVSAVSTATASSVVVRDSNANVSMANALEGYATTATAASTTTLTVASAYQQYFTGTTTQTVVLPVTSTLVLGQAWNIVNNSTGLVTVQSSGLNTVLALAAGTSCIVTCVLVSGTTAASWSYVYFGATVVSGKRVVFNNSITWAGTDGTTHTLPSTSATLARTDAAQTFAGTQTFSSTPTLSSLTTAGVLKNSASGVISSTASTSSFFVMGDGSTVATSTYLATATAASTYQPLATALTTLSALGNPASNGYVLSSTTAGVYSWIPVSGGGGTVTSVALSAPSIFTVSGSPITTNGTLSFAWNGSSANIVLGNGTTVAASTYLTTSAAASAYQPLDGDLTSIAGLAGTTGWLKKTAANTWALDTSTFLTANQSITLSGDASGSGTTAITVAVNKLLGNNIPANASGALTNNGTGTLSWVNYLTTAPTITLTGDVSGSGTGTFTTTIANSTVTGKALTGYVVGTNVALAATDSVLGAFGKIQGQLNVKASAAPGIESTGLYYWASPYISIATGTTFNVGAVQGQIVDTTTTPGTPIITQVNYPGQSGVTDQYVTTSITTYLYIDSTGTLQQQSTALTPSQRRSNLYLGILAHPLKTVLTSVDIAPDICISVMAQNRDMWSAINFVNRGIIPYANGANLNINITGGLLYGLGINWSVDPLNPMRRTIGPYNIASFKYRLQDGTTYGSTTSINPTQYDNASVLTTVGGGSGSSTNQWIFTTSYGQILIQFGQVVYSNLEQAVASVGSEAFITPPDAASNLHLIGILAVNKNATNLSDPTQARFVPVSRFGEVAAGSSGATTATFQSIYNNSTIPQISTSAAIGTFTIHRATASDADTVFAVTNGASATTFSVTGAGDVTGSKFITSGSSSLYFVLGDGSTVLKSSYALLSSPTFTGTLTTPALTLSGFSTGVLINTSGVVSALSGTNIVLANGSTLAQSTYLTGNQTITLSGDVTGSGTTSITTALSASTVTGKLLTGYTVGSNAVIAATDSILGAFGKLQAQITATPGTVTSVALSAPTLFTVSGSPVTSSGTISFAWNGASSNLVRADGTTVAASSFQASATALTNFASLGNPASNGYVLSSTTAGVLSWVAPGSGGMPNPLTTTGDMVYSSSGTTPARLAIGTANQVLIGGTVPTWSSTLTLGGKLTVPASTTGSAGFRLQQGVAPTAPGDGDFWITSSGVYAQAAGSTLKLNANGALYYSSTTAVYVTNTTVASSLGSTSLSSAAMTPGNVVSVLADGYVKYNTLSDSVAITVHAATTDITFNVVGSSIPSGVVNTNYHWKLDGRLTPATGPGAGSTVKFFGRFSVVGTGAEYISDISQSMTIDTSTSITFDLRAQWSGTGANNSIGSEYMVVQQINSIGGGGGSVISVALSTPSIFTVTGSPITSSGTLGFSWNGSSSNLVRADGSTIASSSFQPSSPTLTNFSSLGNPSTNGYVLSSTTAGVLSWVAGGSGGFIGTTTNGVAYYDGTALTNSSNLTYNGSYITSQGASFGVNTSLSGWAWFGSSAFGGAANYPGFWQSHTTGELGLWAATGTQISFAEATVGNIARLNAGGLYPETDNTFSLGTSAKAWAAAYAVSGRFNNTVLGNLSTVTSGVTTALTAASPQVIEFTGSTASHKCSLPDTTNLSIGRRFEIYNNATVPVLIQNSDLTSIITVSASSSVTVICKAQTGAVGDWIVDDKLALSGGTITGQIYGITATAAPLIDVRTSYPGVDNSAIRAEATGAGGQAIYARSSVDNAYGIWAHAVTGINSVALYAIASDGATAIKAVCDGSGYAGTFTGNVRITGTTTLNTSMTGVLQATSGVISTIDSSAFVRSDTINTFTVDQKFNANVYYGSGTLTAVPAAPLNMLASAAATMKTQLNLINTGGNAGAGACIDFYTYDVAGMTNPGMRIGALDNSYSADFVLYIKTPNSPTGALVERFRVTNSGVGTLPGGLTCTTGKLGYSTGAGGTVTQATSKSTGVTLNKQCGNITMNGAALANAATVTFTLTNSFITANDMVVVRHRSAGTLGAYNIAGAPAAGSCTISVRNVHTASLSEAIVLQFFVLSAVVA